LIYQKNELKQQEKGVFSFYKNPGTKTQMGAQFLSSIHKAFKFKLKHMDFLATIEYIIILC
jgi:hypothetical protein